MTTRSRTIASLIWAAVLLVVAIGTQPPARAQQSVAPIGGVAMMPPGSAGDFTADGVLGQGNFLQDQRNFIDGRGFNPQNGNLSGDIAIDRLSTPNHVYVADTNNNRVLGWRDVAKFKAHAVADAVFGQPDFSSSLCDRGTFSPSRTGLCSPAGVAVDSAHRLYVADTNNNRVLEFNNPFPTSTTTNTIPHDVFGQSGLFNSSSCNSGSSSSGTLCNPVGLAVDGADNLYVADSVDNRVLEFNTPEKLTAVKGSGDNIADRVFGQLNNFSLTQCNSSGTNANSLCTPLGVAVDSKKNLYIADYVNNRVLEYNTPLAVGGNTIADKVFGQGGTLNTSACNKTGINADSLCQPARVMVDTTLPDSNLYIADRTNNRVLEYNTPLAAGGNTTADRVFGQTVFTVNVCNAGSIPTASRLCAPNGLAVDGAAPSNLYVFDVNNNRVLEYNTPLTNKLANAVAGQLLFTTNVVNQLDQRGFDFGFSTSAAIAIDRSVNPPRVYVADYNNNRVLGYSSVAAFLTHGAANLVFGQPNPSANSCDNGGVINEKTLCFPRGVAVDAAGNLYIADSGTNRVLEYNKPFVGPAPGGDTKADRVFGQGGSFTTSSCNGPGVTANSLCFPQGLAVDVSNNLYVVDDSNSRVLEYDTPLAGGGDTTADRVFGQGNNLSSSGCNNGGVTANGLCFPAAVAVDASKNVYIADLSNNRVLEYDTPLAVGGNTTADKVFGQGGSFLSATCNSGGVNASTLCFPRGVAVDSAKNVYIADASNSRVLKYKLPLTTDQVADQVLGQNGLFTQNSCGTISATSLCTPDSVAVDASKNLYVGDASTNRVLEYFAP